MRLWLTGGAPTVRLVMILRWTKLVGGRVKGEIKVFERDAAGNPHLLQTEVMVDLHPFVLAVLT
jgi:hypothetical protein